MTEAEAAIADLDAALAEFGEEIVFQRFGVDGEGAQTVINQAVCRANVSPTLPQELVPMTGEGPNTKIIISPTGLIAAAWPGLPIKDDRVLIGGVANNVELITQFSIGPTLVRLELQTRA